MFKAELDTIITAGIFNDMFCSIQVIQHWKVGFVKGCGRKPSRYHPDTFLKKLWKTTKNNQDSCLRVEI
jgi:hypothetical protein